MTLTKKIFNGTIDVILIVLSLYYSIASILLFILAMFLPSDMVFYESPNFLYITSLVVIMIYGTWVFIDVVFIKSKMMPKYFLMISIVVCLLALFNYLSFFGIVPGISVTDAMFDPLQIIFLFATMLPLFYMMKYFRN